MKSLLVITLLFSTATLPLFANSTSMDEELKAALDHYQSGTYNKSEQIADKLLKSEETLDNAQLTKLYLLKARIGFAFSADKKAKTWLNKLCLLDPQAELDPLKDTPEARAIWTDMRADINTVCGRKFANATSAPPTRLQKTARFWIKLVPFGVGHFDAGQYVTGTAFLLGESAAVYSRAVLLENEKSFRDVSINAENELFPKTVAPLLFAGIWGYELLDLLDEMKLAAPGKQETVRYYLSVFPLGVAQAKNHEYGKALGFGIIQLSLLATTIAAERKRVRQGAFGLLVTSIVYGAFDGWANHLSSEAPTALQTFRPTLEWHPNQEKLVGITLLF